MTREAPTGPRKPKSLGSAYRQADRYLSLAYQIALSMLVYVGIGFAIDWWLNTLPWFTLAGAVVGFVAMMIVLVRFAKQNPPGARQGDGRDRPGDGSSAEAESQPDRS